MDRRPSHHSSSASVYRKRRALAIFALVLGIAALIFAVFAQSSVATKGALPIDPSKSGPETVLAEAAGVEVYTPVPPADLTGLGYHPEGDSLLEMKPRGENLSNNALLGLFAGGKTPEDIGYYLMDPAGRAGPRTGALDVGAKAGATIYAPTDGVITSIRPDPTIQHANVVEIKPQSNPNVRVSVSLVSEISDGVGVDSPVTAGTTELGTVADSASYLDPQLAGYTTDSGNHATISVSRVN
jgi:hypothetical protein